MNWSENEVLLRSGSPAGKRTWEWGAALLVLVHFGSFPWVDHPITTDVRCFLYYAARTAQGSWPHLAFFENKMPLAFFAGAGLHRLGALLDAEGFYLVRLGYLGLAALNAWLAYLIHARLWQSRVVGLLGLAPFLAVPILGGLPAIGNVPKLLMAICASGSALMAARRSWYWVGVLGGLATLDWQVGGLVVIAGCAAAVVSEGNGRRRAGVAVVLGALIPFLALVTLYALLGGLKPLLGQTVMASFSRGVATVSSQGVMADWPRRLRLILGSHVSRPAVAALAMPGLPFLVLGRTSGAMLPPTVVLAVYHAGIMAFSLLDFQVYGDLFILYNSLAFLAGTTLCWLYRRVERRASEPSVTVTKILLPRVCALLLGLALAQPWVSRRAVRIVPRPPGTLLTLEDQRSLAGRLKPLFANYRVAVLGPAEILLLTDMRNPVLPVYWNHATHAYFRKSKEEGMGETLRRIVREASCDFVVCDREFPQGRCAESLGGFPHREELSAGGYGVDVYDVRKGRGTGAP